MKHGQRTWTRASSTVRLPVCNVDTYLAVARATIPRQPRISIERKQLDACQCLRPFMSARLICRLRISQVVIERAPLSMTNSGCQRRSLCYNSGGQCSASLSTSTKEAGDATKGKRAKIAYTRNHHHNQEKASAIHPKSTMTAPCGACRAKMS